MTGDDVEEKLCQSCKKNHAVRSYIDPKTPTKRELYCLECYARLFLEAGVGESLSACPYCGMSLKEIERGKIVGCAHCYSSMQAGVLPVIQKMQGGRAHVGKTPSIEGYEKGYLSKEYRRMEIEKARFERQCRELEIIIENLKAQEKYEDAKGYAEKLALMKNRSAVEEDFVWRTRRNSSKQS